MTQTGETDLAPRRGRARIRRAGVWVLVSSVVTLVLVLVMGLAVLLFLSGRPFAAPAWVTHRVEARLDAVMGGTLSVDLGGVELFLEEGWHPRIRLRNLVLVAPQGWSVARVPDLRLVLDRDALIEGRVRPTSLLLPDVALHLKRTSDGSLDPPLGTSQPQGLQTFGSLPALLEALDAMLATPQLSLLRDVAMDRLSLVFDDARTGRSWTLERGRLHLTQTGQDTRADATFVVASDQGEAPATATLAFRTAKGSLASRLDVDVRDVPARDIAIQAPAMAWLGVLDARVSGTFHASTGSDGALLPATARLDIGPGRFGAGNGAPPVPFDGATLAFDFDAATSLFTFSQIDVDSSAVRLRASGQAMLDDFDAGLPRTLISQVTLTEVTADPRGLFEAPVRFSGGRADVKLAFDPIRVTIGQAVLWEGEERVSLSGTLQDAPTGWETALDLTVNRIAADRLLALWPPALVVHTREWIADNVAAGMLFNVQGAVRLTPGKSPRLSLGYEFADADVRVLRTLPPVQGGAGRAAMDGTRYTMMLDRGRVEAPQGGMVDVAGSTFVVPDIAERPLRAELSLRAEGPVTAALSLLDQPPFAFLSKAGRTPDLATGRASVVAHFAFPLTPRIAPRDIRYDVAADLRDIRSDTIVPGRVLESDLLHLTATPEGMEIGGPGRLSGVAFTGSWTQSLRPEDRAQSRIDAVVPLDANSAAAFAPGLPRDLLAGQAQARLRIDLARGTAPRFSLTSDLRGARMSLAALNWTKAANMAGRLAVSGRLGRPVSVEAIALSAPGLTLTEGSLRLSPQGGLDRARFGRVRTPWLDAPVTLTGRGPGRAPAIAVTGGTVDLRRMPPRGGTGKGGGAAVPLDVTLDRLTVSPTLALTALSGRFNVQGGLAGPFQGRLNGAAPVSGMVAGGRVRLHADDAGATLRAAGLTDRAAGGVLDLLLSPRERPGDYDGTLHIADLRLRDAPTLANLLSAISVVGLVEQLSGEGFLFSTVSAEFRLTPGAVEIKTASAVGPSLGVTAAGVFMTGSKRVELTGVVSPIYLLNRVGSLISRQGEGLFGFTYAISGTMPTPAIRVNPLSLLAPGPLRDLFRPPTARLAP